MRDYLVRSLFRLPVWLELLVAKVPHWFAVELQKFTKIAVQVPGAKR